MMPVKTNNEAGFSLIEAVVCLAIAGLILSAFFSTTSSNIQLSTRSIDKSEAAITVHQLINRVGSDIPITQLTRRGEVDDQTDWQLEISLQDASEFADVSGTRIPLYRISITITNSLTQRVIDRFETFRVGQI